VVAMFVGSWIAGHLMARGGTTAPEPRLGARPA
jgi:hypothetical protein